MTHTLLLLQHESCSPTRGDDGPSCVFGVLNLWEKTLIPTSGRQKIKDWSRMTHTLLLLQHESCSPTRGGDGPSCVFGVLNLWEKTLIPTSAIPTWKLKNNTMKCLLKEGNFRNVAKCCSCHAFQE